MAPAKNKGEYQYNLNLIACLRILLLYAIGAFVAGLAIHYFLVTFLYDSYSSSGVLISDNNPLYMFLIEKGLAADSKAARILVTPLVFLTKMGIAFTLFFLLSRVLTRCKNTALYDSCLFLMLVLFQTAILHLWLRRIMNMHIPDFAFYLSTETVAYWESWFTRTLQGWHLWYTLSVIFLLGSFTFYLFYPYKNEQKGNSRLGVIMAFLSCIILFLTISFIFVYNLEREFGDLAA